MKNMKKNRTKLGFILVLVIASLLLTVACAPKKDDTKLVIGVSPAPHAEIVKLIQEDLAKQGVTLEIREFNDYKTPNIALSDGDIDANYFQHIPYFADENRVGKYNLEILCGVHIEPMGFYSKTLTSLDDIPDGAEIMIPNDTTNEGRALLLLQDKGLITLKEGVVGGTATPHDIADNPKNLVFTELEAATIPQAYADADGAVINGNYAIEHGLNPMKDALAVEGTSSPYVNIVAVRNGDAAKEAFKKLAEVLQSDKVKEYIESKYEGAVVPAFQNKEEADKLASQY